MTAIKTVTPKSCGIEIKIRQKTYMRSPAGWYVYVDGKQYFRNCLSSREAIDSVLVSILNSPIDYCRDGNRWKIRFLE